jgi:hypothetical protein
MGQSSPIQRGHRMKDLRPSAIMRLKALAPNLRAATESLERRNNSLQSFLVGSGWIIRPMIPTEPTRPTDPTKVR